MKLVVISPESDEPREHAVLAGLFSAGLERYHVRKPDWSREKLSAWVKVVPEQWRTRLVLHQHHDLVVGYGCGGVHFKDSEGRARPLGAPRFLDGLASNSARFVSRSCHDIETLEASLGSYDAVFFSPVFPSISKKGYVPSVALDEVAAVLGSRGAQQRKTTVIALGGITPANAVRGADLGFDGVAVLGALWQAAEPLAVFDQLQQSIAAHVA